MSRSIEESSKSVSVSDPELTAEEKDKVAQQVVVEADVSAAADVNGGPAVTAGAQRAESDVQEIAAGSSGSATKEEALTGEGGEVVTGVEDGAVKDITAGGDTTTGEAVKDMGDTTAGGEGDDTTAGVEGGNTTTGVADGAVGKDMGDTTPADAEDDVVSNGVKEDQGERTISSDKATGQQ